MSRKREYRKRTVPELTMSSKSALFSLSFSLCSHLKKIQSSFFLPLLPHPLRFHFITTSLCRYRIRRRQSKKQLAMSRQKIESPPTVIIISSSQHVQQRSEQAGRRVVHSVSDGAMAPSRPAEKDREKEGKERLKEKTTEKTTAS